MNKVVVIGGGHAGVEAAAAAARCGAAVILVTQRPDCIGAMSCNPSIGGVGKGHIVREIDALDGIMARAADAAAIHHRMLNSSKGRAVHGPRVQADRKLYAKAVQRLIADQSNLRVVRGDVVALSLAGDRIAGVRLDDGTIIAAQAVVIATGTFLSGKLFRGEEREEGGRVGERPALPLADQLRQLGIATGRLKTGTPPRLDGRTIDWSRLIPQPSDDSGWTMSSMSSGRTVPQLACALTRTTTATHDVIRQAMHRSPLFGGAIEGSGPRYCPSIEDKVVRFGDRDGHQLFLEPEGLDDTTIYPNGISTSLPVDVQQALLATIPGLEQASIVEPGYAVEYDCLDPRQLGPTLQSRLVAGLFCAGQVNGTTGYEEAAGQGLVAGVNAAAHALERTPLLLDRASSYLGVMIDDLVLQGVTEPYRMLTARAEYRLSLRADNAEARLTTLGIDAGCLSPERRDHVARRDMQRAEIEAVLASREDGCRPSLAEMLVTGELDEAAIVDRVAAPADLAAEVAADVRYKPYVERQKAEIAHLRRAEQDALPTDIAFAAVPGLSTEMIERLEVSRPTSLAAAGRIRGITPAALSAILLHVRRRAA
jgi:tRNA uridine 5-carboxymethylaminomethyl modification enzyme